MGLNDPILERLEDQISWYDRRSQSNQRWFKWLKAIVILTGSVIPFLAATGAPSFLTGFLGVLIVFLEGLQHLNQYQYNWIIYRSTCESLKHEKYLYLARAGPYAFTDNPRALLAERVESLVSQEHAKWVSLREVAAKFIDHHQKLP
jgi:hypothetical protein